MEAPLSVDVKELMEMFRFVYMYICSNHRHFTNIYTCTHAHKHTNTHTSFFVLRSSFFVYPHLPDFTCLISSIEERVYRHRCVEAWSIVVPWDGFPLVKLMEKVRVKNDAKYILFETFMDAKVASTQDEVSYYPWPYTEVPIPPNRT